MQSRRTQRESVNAELPSRRALEENRRVAIFQSVIAGDVDFHDDAKRRDMLAMAKRCLEAVLVRCHGQPCAGERCEITRRTSSGASVVMDTGLDEAGLVRKMEETIVRLSRSRIPNDEEMAIRREFKELPTQQARAQWIGRLWGSENPVDAHKARTVAVMVLHERGVADAGVDLFARADRHLVLARVERLRVAVEDLSDLLARERPEAALHQLRVHGLLRRQAELRADLGDLVRLGAAPRERVHERLLDRDHLGVGKRDLVPAGARDVVVDLVDRVRVLETHLAGVVPAGGDGLELLEADRDVGELDGKGRGGAISEE